MALLRNEGWLVNAKRVERIWRREGLKVRQGQPKRGCLWFNDVSCVRPRPQYSGHVWSYDFFMDCTHDGKAFRMLSVIDEHSRQCLAVLTELFQRHGPPDHIRSGNGAEFTAQGRSLKRQHEVLQKSQRLGRDLLSDLDRLMSDKNRHKVGRDSPIR